MPGDSTRPLKAWWQDKMWTVTHLDWNLTKKAWNWVRLLIQEPFEQREVLAEEVILLWPTGLQDKNGTEIYQDDIFKSDDRVDAFVVVFFDGSFRGHYEPAEPSFLAPGFRFDTYEASRGEVIGNIHTDPSLLTQKPGGEDA